MDVEVQKSYILFTGTIKLGQEVLDRDWILIKTEKKGGGKIEECIDCEQKEYPWGSFCKISLKNEGDQLLFVSDERRGMVRYSKGSPLLIGRGFSKRDLIVFPKPQQIHKDQIGLLTCDCING